MKNIPTPDDLNLFELQKRFPDSETAREYLEALRWEKGPVCPHCSNTERIWIIGANKEKKIRHGLYQCGVCNKQFTVTVGTIFEKSLVPLHKWLIAFYLLNASKKGISALQIQRMLGLGSYRTAHFMMHRIRHTLKLTGFEKPLGGTVEVDETYVGGKPRPKKVGKNTISISKEKSTVVSMVERHDGRKVSLVMNTESMRKNSIPSCDMQAAILANVAKFSRIVTDEGLPYRALSRYTGFDHSQINHSKKQYALKDSRGFNVNTNTVESSFALLKRGIIGTFHNVSKRHLHLYVAEFDHRWNFKKTTDGHRMVEALKLTEGKRLTYHKPKRESVLAFFLMEKVSKFDELMKRVVQLPKKHALASFQASRGKESSGFYLQIITSMNNAYVSQKIQDAFRFILEDRPLEDRLISARVELAIVTTDHWLPQVSSGLASALQKFRNIDPREDSKQSAFQFWQVVCASMASDARHPNQ